VAARILRLVFGFATGSLLAAITVLTTLDVVGRYLFNRPLRGAFELTEVLMAALIFAALPLVTLRCEHIAVDLLDLWIPARARKLQSALIQLACAGVVAVLAWVMFGQARQMALDGLQTDALRLPLAPIVYFGAAAILVSALVHLALAGNEMRR
jgi:TRAP-type C4-dicarboxylate transport system permease small subunit